MKAAKLHIDFSDRPKLVEALRLHSVQSGMSQKDVVASALEAYLAHRAESLFLLSLAAASFSEWENAEDAVYDDL